MPYLEHNVAHSNILMQHKKNRHFYDLDYQFLYIELLHKNGQVLLHILSHSKSSPLYIFLYWHFILVRYNDGC